MVEPFRFTAETNIEEALSLDDRVVQAMKALGLKCVNAGDEMCPAATVETLREAFLYHDVPLDRILAALNALQIPSPPPAGPPA